jgi:hypothetical protein
MSAITEGDERGRHEEIRWNGAPVNAWVPRPLVGQVFELSVRTARRTEQAAAAARAGGSVPARFEPLAMLMLRAEGVASSYIEGLRTPLAEVAAAEAGSSANPTATLIADNLAAVVEALHAPGKDLGIQDLHRWHRRLMEASPVPEAMIGAFRAQQSWIGGTSPRDASLVPPPPERVAPLMEDLVAFVNEEGTDPITQAAVAHVQFEAIHPYADGNGRIGRMLIGYILARRLGITLPPPVSVVMAGDPGGYLAGMVLYRMGQVDAWVAWVATAVVRSSEAAQSAMARTDALFARWEERVSDLRADATARCVLALLGEYPVVTSDRVAGRLAVSERAARGALGVLADRSILAPYRVATTRSGRPRRYWVAGELLAIMAGWPGN